MSTKITSTFHLYNYNELSGAAKERAESMIESAELSNHKYWSNGQPISAEEYGYAVCHAVDQILPFDLPEIESYSENTPQSNCMRMSFTFIDLYFSYSTIVAFRYRAQLYVIKNYWSTTTGKHLNWIDGGRKKSRLSEEDFNQKLNEVLSDIRRRMTNGYHQED